MKIIIAGGSGFLGTALTKRLLELSKKLEQPYDVTWVSRHAQSHQFSAAPMSAVSVISYDNLHQLESCDVLINLAGAGVADKPWTKKRKQLLRDSRLVTTQKLLDWMRQLKTPPHTFISSSAIGWYGVQGDSLLTESSAPVDEFQHHLCNDWEILAQQATDITQLYILRTGVVLHPTGGMLAKLQTPFSFGLGGRLGQGKQVLSWISLNDWLNATLFLLQQKAKPGIYNLTAPEAVTNAEFTRLFAKQLKRPAFFHVPAFALKLLLGDMSRLLLCGQHVLPDKLLTAGFNFQHTDLTSMLADYYA